MLTLLDTPAWHAPGAAPLPLPLTLPAALLVVLAAEGDWLSRERLALVFWPDASPADALHHLRINLHRAKSLLSGWGQAEALQTERARLRLTLPTDLALLRQAMHDQDAEALEQRHPRRWLQGWQLPAYGGFAQWCDERASALQAEWLAASRRQLPLTAAAPGPARAALDPPPGRDSEARRLLHSAAPALVLLGEPGAGKTTLLRWAWPQAPILQGLEGLDNMPLRPVLACLREHEAALARALRDPYHPLRPYKLDLARVLPELAPDEPLPPLDAITAQTRLTEALSRAFETLTPVLLVDDLQWCDSATVEWLLMLAHSGRLRWRGAARRHEVSPALQRALEGLRATSRVEVLDLPPIGPDAMAQACDWVGHGQALSPEALERLHQLSGGNAFLLGELLRTDLRFEQDEPAAPLRSRIDQLVIARLAALPGDLRAAIEQAAVFVHPVPASALMAPHRLPAGAPGDWDRLCQRGVEAGLLQHVPAGLACRHDLVRQAVVRAMPPAQRIAMHRHAAMWLVAQTHGQSAPDGLTIADHWSAAGEHQTALAWRHRGAEQAKSRGDFALARALWRQVADEAEDPLLGLRAQLELAACDLMDNLARGLLALEAVEARLHSVEAGPARDPLESRLRSALVDNRVFAGDLAEARRHADRLRELLPGLQPTDQAEALEVLIELAMREPDIPGAWAWLAQLQRVAPQRPSLLSFEGQIHYFGGQVQAAHDALDRLLRRHPDYCSGITVENDLAVMLHQMGRVDEAEAMVRRSLQSWAGVVHTETLSLLVLGSVLTSAGRADEAQAALERARALAQAQSSPAFEVEALLREARLALQTDRPEQARLALSAAEPLMADSTEPLRVSQWALARVQCAQALAQPWPVEAQARLADAAQRSTHPVVQVRSGWVQQLQAQRHGHRAEALAAARATAELARRHGLMEWAIDGLLQQGALHDDPGQGRALCQAALTQAQALNLGAVARRATEALTRGTGVVRPVP